MRDRRQQRPLVLFLACAGVLIVGGAEPYALASRTSAVSLSNASTLRPLDFAITGDASRLLAPGVASSIEVAFHNPYSFPISVAQVKVSVHSVTAPNADSTHPCTYADFRILQSSRNLRVTVPATTTSSLAQLRVPRGSWPAIAMVNTPTNQDGCKEAIIALDFAGTGKRLR